MLMRAHSGRFDGRPLATGDLLRRTAIQAGRFGERKFMRNLRDPLAMRILDLAPLGLRILCESGRKRRRNCLFSLFSLRRAGKRTRRTDGSGDARRHSCRADVRWRAARFDIDLHKSNARRLIRTAEAGFRALAAEPDMQLLLHPALDSCAGHTANAFDVSLLKVQRSKRRTLPRMVRLGEQMVFTQCANGSAMRLSRVSAA